MKKTMAAIIGLLACAVCMPLICFADEAPVDSFENDFESYCVTEIYNSSNHITNGRPADGDYSNKTVYPNGENSVYEGNAANNLYVKDANGNLVYGGLDGYVGYYYPDKSTKAIYNQYNRRLTVVAKTKMKNQFLRLEPSKGEEVNASSSFGKENVDLSGVTVWETDVCVTEQVPYAALSLTANPIISGYSYERACDVITFHSDAGTKGTIGKISFMGKEFAEFETYDFYGDFSFLKIRYVLDRSSEIPMHYAFVMKGDEIIAATGPAEFENADEFFADDSNYGVLYTVRAESAVAQPRVLLDNIHFYKAENFCLTNEDEITGGKYKSGDVINVRFNKDIAEFSLENAELYDLSGNRIDISAAAAGNEIQIELDNISLQTTYRLKLRNILNNDNIYFNKELIIKGRTMLEFTSAGKTAADDKIAAELSVRNNTGEEKTGFVIITLNSGSDIVSGGVYVRKFTAAAGAEIKITASDIKAPEDKDYTIRAYIVDKMTSIHSLADVCKF